MAKLQKADVGYGPGMPHCGCCKHFSDDDSETDDEAGSCELVTGKIEEDAWCKLFAPERKPTLAESSGK